LSAVDAEVGKSLFFNCICKELRDKDKAVVLVTHQLQYLQYANKILVLDENGNQVFFGSYEELMHINNDHITIPILQVKSEANEKNIDLKNKSIEQILQEDSDENILNDNSKSHKKYDFNHRAIIMSSMASKILPDEENKDLKVAKNDSIANKNNDAGVELTKKLLLSEHMHDGKVNVESSPFVEEKRGKIIFEKEKGSGQLKSEIVFNYLKSGGVWLGLLFIFLLISSQVLHMMQFYWLNWWATETYGDQTDEIYVVVFSSLTFMCILIGYARAHVWFTYAMRCFYFFIFFAFSFLI
jgi:hypothetical protein